MKEGYVRADEPEDETSKQSLIRIRLGQHDHRNSEVPGNDEEIRPFTGGRYDRQGNSADHHKHCDDDVQRKSDGLYRMSAQSLQQNRDTQEENQYADAYPSRHQNSVVAQESRESVKLVWHCEPAMHDLGCVAHRGH